MICPGHLKKGESCYLPIQNKSFWGLCLSCERIENRCFLEEVQRAIKMNEVEFHFHDKVYSLNDPYFPQRYLQFTVFHSSHQDPRLSLLLLTYRTNKVLFDRCITTFTQNGSFILSANLLYRSHLPQQFTCGMLDRIQQKVRQHFLDLPTCPCCMSKAITRMTKEQLTIRHINHIYGIFRNHTLAQHPTWFVSTFKLLQTIWEKDFEDLITFHRLEDIFLHQNPIQQQIQFRDWIAAFLETPVVIEKFYTNKISLQDKEYLLLWTGQEMNERLLKKILKRRQNETKEELIMRTWHPRRLFTWCLDMEELKDFEPFDESQLNDLQ